MKRIIIFLTAIFLSSCLHFNHKPSEDYARLAAVTLPAFSQTVTSYYGRNPIPQGFDRNNYFEILEKNLYADKNDIKTMKTFTIKTHYLDDKHFSVMICNPNNGYKIMEDLNCNLSLTEIKTWQECTDCPCDFEKSWQKYCK